MKRKDFKSIPLKTYLLLPLYISCKGELQFYKLSLVQFGLMTLQYNLALTHILKFSLFNSWILRLPSYLIEFHT